MLKLKYYRIKANLSQSQLADRIGATQAQVSNWENGLEIPSTHLINLHTVLALEGVIPDGEPPKALGEPVGTAPY